MTDLQRKTLTEMHEKVGMWLENNCDLSANCMMEEVFRTLGKLPAGALWLIGKQAGERNANSS